MANHVDKDVAALLRRELGLSASTPDSMAYIDTFERLRAKNPEKYKSVTPDQFFRIVNAKYAKENAPVDPPPPAAYKPPVGSQVLVPEPMPLPRVAPVPAEASSTKVTEPPPAPAIVLPEESHEFAEGELNKKNYPKLRGLNAAPPSPVDLAMMNVISGNDVGGMRFALNRAVKKVGREAVLAALREIPLPDKDEYPNGGGRFFGTKSGDMKMRAEVARMYLDDGTIDWESRRKKGMDNPLQDAMATNGDPGILKHVLAPGNAVVGGVKVATRLGNMPMWINLRAALRGEWKTLARSLAFNRLNTLIAFEALRRGGPVDQRMVSFKVDAANLGVKAQDFASAVGVSEKSSAKIGESAATGFGVLNSLAWTAPWTALLGDPGQAWEIMKNPKDYIGWTAEELTMVARRGAFRSVLGPALEADYRGKVPKNVEGVLNAVTGSFGLDAAQPGEDPDRGSVGRPVKAVSKYFLNLGDPLIDPLLTAVQASTMVRNGARWRSAMWYMTKHGTGYGGKPYVGPWKQWTDGLIAPDALDDVIAKGAKVEVPEGGAAATMDVGQLQLGEAQSLRLADELAEKHPEVMNLRGAIDHEEIFRHQGATHADRSATGGYLQEILSFLMTKDEAGKEFTGERSIGELADWEKLDPRGILAQSVNTVYNSLKYEHRMSPEQIQEFFNNLDSGTRKLSQWRRPIDPPAAGATPPPGKPQGPKTPRGKGTGAGPSAPEAPKTPESSPAPAPREAGSGDIPEVRIVRDPRNPDLWAIVDADGNYMVRPNGKPRVFKTPEAAQADVDAAVGRGSWRLAEPEAPAPAAAPAAEAPPPAAAPEPEVPAPPAEAPAPAAPEAPTPAKASEEAPPAKDDSPMSDEDVSFLVGIARRNGAYDRIVRMAARGVPDREIARQLVGGDELVVEAVKLDSGLTPRPKAEAPAPKAPAPAPAHPAQTQAMDLHVEIEKLKAQRSALAGRKKVGPKTKEKIAALDDQIAGLQRKMNDLGDKVAEERGPVKTVEQEQNAAKASLQAKGDQAFSSGSFEGIERRPGALVEAMDATGRSPDLFAVRHTDILTDVDNVALGRKSILVDNNGRRYNVQYAIVPSSYVRVSHTTDFAWHKDFGHPDIQPRNYADNPAAQNLIKSIWAESPDNPLVPEHLLDPTTGVDNGPSVLHRAGFVPQGNNRELIQLGLEKEGKLERLFSPAMQAAIERGDFGFNVAQVKEIIDKAGGPAHVRLVRVITDPVDTWADLASMVKSMATGAARARNRSEIVGDLAAQMQDFIGSLRVGPGEDLIAAASKQENAPFLNQLLGAIDKNSRQLYMADNGIGLNEAGESLLSSALAVVAFPEPGIVRRLGSEGRSGLASGIARSFSPIVDLMQRIKQGKVSRDYDITDGLRASLDLLDWKEANPGMTTPMYFSTVGGIFSGPAARIPSVNPRTALIAEALLSSRDKPTLINNLMKELHSVATQGGGLFGGAVDPLAAIAHWIKRVHPKIEDRALKIDLEKFLDDAHHADSGPERSVLGSISDAFSRKGVEVQPGIDVARMTGIVTNMYEKERYSTIPRELAQNSFDAITAARSAGDSGSGNIHFSIEDPDNNTVKMRIEDDGIGMSPHDLSTRFVDLAAEGVNKGQEGSAGGMGLAKALFLYQAREATVTSVWRDPKTNTLVKSTLTKDKGGMRLRSESLGTDAGVGANKTGTTMDLAYEHTDDVHAGTTSSSAKYTASVAFKEVFKYPDIAGVNVSVSRIWGSQKTTDALTVDTPSTLLSAADIDGARVELWAVEAAERRSFWSVPLLNNGMTQSSHGVTGYKGTDASRMQRGLAINIVSKSSPDKPNYPWTPTRERVKEPVAKQIREMVEAHLVSTAIKVADTTRQKFVERTVGIDGRWFVDIFDVFDGQERQMFAQDQKLQKLYDATNAGFEDLRSIIAGVPAKSAHITPENVSPEFLSFNGFMFAGETAGVRFPYAGIQGSRDAIAIDPFVTANRARIFRASEKLTPAKYGAHLASVLVHELAHQVTKRGWGSFMQGSHGDDWSHAYTSLMGDPNVQDSVMRIRDAVVETGISEGDLDLYMETAKEVVARKEAKKAAGTLDTDF